MNNITELIAGLTPEQRELLQRRLRTLEKKEAAARTGIGRVGRDTDTFPVSLAQRRLWFLDQLDPDNAAYNIVMAVRLEGHLDLEALRRALNEIVRRHESLRTSFAAVDGQPAQVVAPELPLPLRVTNLEGVPAGEREAQVRRIAAAEVGTPFDLAQAPLARVALLRLSPREHVLILPMHHIISDGLSVGVIIHEVATLYTAYTAGRPSPLPELEIQYVDFAAWQREWLRGEVLERQLGYWTRQLGGDLPALKLPTDRPYPLVQSFRGDRLHFRLPSDLSESLRELAQREGATLFMTLLAAFKALLLRYSGQTDILLGTPVANRTRAETQPLIGFFINTLVLRTDLSGDPTFRELLARVREVTLEAFANQDVPFDHLVETLQPERSLTRTPIYQAMFTFEREVDMRLELPGLTLSPAEDIQRETSKFELLVTMTERGPQVGGVFEYNTDLFDASTVERMIRHYERLLAGVAADPDARLSRLPLLGEDERRRLVSDWNQTDAEYPRDRTFAELFEEQAARTPDATAAACRGSELTYAALDSRAARAARALAAAGAGPETVVALLGDRGLNLLTSILAAFRAGAAYLPLDPRYPARRLAQVLAQSGAPLVVVGAEQSGALAEALAEMPEGERPRVLSMEELCAAAEAEGASESLRAPSAAGPRGLAYVIYTSGSTGRPKGVMVEQRGMVNHIFAKVRELGLTRADVLAQTAPQSFDISVWQFLAALAVGGRVEIMPDEIAHDPARLLEEVEHSGVTVLEIVPALLRVMLEEVARRGASHTRPGGLRWLVPTGEALPPELCRDWLGLYPHVPLVNAYGPTECSDDVTHHKVEEPPAPEVVNVPIGRPLQNTRLYVLDPRGGPLPAGAAGELYVGGDGVGRGYLHDPARTAEVFVPDPFSGAPGARLYRTGDLARYLADGRVEFLGRVDHQVKVRGNRIELGEIESVIRSHPSVKDAVALVREDAPGEQRLVAYVARRQAAAESNGHGDHSDQVAAWEVIWNETYKQTTPEHEATFNIVGWNSSYTGEPIPEDEVREWRDLGVERILSLGPRRVLEIGVGVGLLMHRLAPVCSDYLGTDFSAEALDILRRQLAQPELAQPHVRLTQREADDFTGIEPDSYQVAILNSVSQYLPSIDYMLRVMEGAVAAVEPGGFVYVGDVRSYPLLELFHTSVQLHQAADALPLAQLRQRVRKHMEQDKELVIDPAFFLALKRHLPKIGGVYVQLKRGRYHNELTRFRYDVLLRVGEVEEPAPGYPVLDWQSEGLTPDSLRRRLQETEADMLVVRRVPSARLRGFARDLAELREAGESETVGEFRRRLASLPEEPSYEPQDYWDLGRELPFAVSVSWSGAGAEGFFDVAFRRRAEGGAAESAWLLPAGEAEVAEVRPWREYATDPEEVKRQRQLGSELRGFVEQRLPDYMIPAAFVILDELPLTSNGKIDRKALPAPDVVKRDVEEAYVAPRSPAERLLAGIWSEVLRVEQVGVDDNFFELGGDSILSIQIISRANQAGLHLTPRQIFQHQTISELALVAGASPGALAEQGLVTGPVLLTPVQHWILGQEMADPNHYNLAVLLELRRPVEPELLRPAGEAVVLHHDALRLRFEPEGGGWRQHNAGAEAGPAFETASLEGLTPDEQRAEIERVAAEAQTRLDMREGPTVRFVLFDLGDERPGRLLIVIHHLTIDSVSWQILLEDLQTALEQLRAGRAVQLPPKTTSFRHWAERLRGYAQTPKARAEADYWLGQNWRGVAPLPVDFEGGENTEGSMRKVGVEFSAAETQQLLRSLPAAYRAQIDDAILTSLGQSFAELTGGRPLMLDLEGHGREGLFDDVDLSRTVGMFSAVYPLLLETRPAADPGESLKAVKEQLRTLPQKGIGYGILRYLCEEPELAARLRAVPQAEVAFNYWGQLDRFLKEDAPFAAAGESAGASFGPHNLRPYLIEINASVVGGKLRTHWAYSANVHRRETVERLAGRFADSLRALLAHCQSPEAGGFTPSDFEAARLGQGELDTFLSRIGRPEEVH